MCVHNFLRYKLLQRRRRYSSTAPVAYHRAANDEVCCWDRGGAGGGGEDALVAKRFTWGQIERMTSNFSVVVGAGGFSTVYLGQFSSIGGSSPPPSLGAVKVSSLGGDRLNLAFQQELDVLLRLQHERIVKLIGYCDDEEDRGAFVFEHVPCGTLHENLHGVEERRHSILPWDSRVKIAFQLAQAIAYLHEKCTLHVIHGDIKTSNILLDHKSNCKLCDFGSANMGFSSMINPPSASPSSPVISSSPPIRRKQIMMGSPGYTDPYYLRTGTATKKNDIYSFGVVVLELVTGSEAFCIDKAQLLTTMAGGHVVKDVEFGNVKVASMVDPKLKGEFEMDEARSLIYIASTCIQESPICRPSACRVLEMMTERLLPISSMTSEHKLWKCGPIAK